MLAITTTTTFPRKRECPDARCGLINVCEYLPRQKLVLLSVRSIKIVEAPVPAGEQL
jgi:hypothetical protein